MASQPGRSRIGVGLPGGVPDIPESWRQLRGSLIEHTGHVGRTHARMAFSGRSGPVMLLLYYAAPVEDTQGSAMAVASASRFAPVLGRRPRDYAEQAPETLLQMVAAEAWSAFPNFTDFDPLSLCQPSDPEPGSTFVGVGVCALGTPATDWSTRPKQRADVELGKDIAVQCSLTLVDGSWLDLATREDGQWQLNTDRPVPYLGPRTWIAEGAIPADYSPPPGTAQFWLGQIRTAVRDAYEIDLRRR